MNQQNINNQNNFNWDRASKIFTPDKISFFQQLNNKINQYPKTKMVLILLAAGCFWVSRLFLQPRRLLSIPYLRSGIRLVKDVSKKQ